MASREETIALWQRLRKEKPQLAQQANEELRALAALGDDEPAVERREAHPRQADPDPAKAPTFGQKVAAMISPPEVGKDAIAATEGFADSMSLGAVPWLMDKAGLDTPEERAERASAATQPAVDSWTKGLPHAQTSGKISGFVGSAAVGPLARAGQTGVNIAKGATQLAPKAIPKLLTNVGANAVGQGAASVGTELLDAGFHGREANVGEAAGVGAAMGGYGTLVADLLEGVPAIGRFLTAKKSGVYDQPDMKELPGGDRGMQRAAEVGLKRVIGRDQEMAGEASGAYHGAVTPKLKQRVDGQQIVGELNAARGKNIDPDTGLPVTDAADNKLIELINRTPDGPTVEGSLMRRRALRDASAFDSPSPTDAQQASRSGYHALRAGIRTASPDVAKADDAYAAFADKARRRRDIMFNTEDEVVQHGGDLPETKPPSEPADEMAAGVPQSMSEQGPKLRVGKAKSAATLLKRINDTNEPGLRAEAYLQELAEQDPKFREALDWIAAKKDFEATSFGLKGMVPTSLTGATSAAGFMPLIKQNARAIGAEVLHPIHSKMAKNAPTLLGGKNLTFNLLDDADAERQRKAKKKKD